MAEWFQRVIGWFVANKDAVLAIVALIAVVAGPYVQLKIARRQFSLTGRQLDLQERTAAANLLGAADQKWVDDFRETIAELEGLITDEGTIQDTQEQSGNPSYQIDRGLELGHRIDLLVAKVFLMVGPANDRELTKSIRTWSTAKDVKRRADLGFHVFDLAWRIIEQKQAGIAARIAPLSRGITRRKAQP